MTEALDPGAPRGAPFLAVSEIRKSFGGVQALKGVSLDLRAGEVTGLVGALRRRQVDDDPHPCRSGSAGFGGIEDPLAAHRYPDPHRADGAGPWVHRSGVAGAGAGMKVAAGEHHAGRRRCSRLERFLVRRRRAGERPLNARASPFLGSSADLQAFDGRALAGVDLSRPGAECRADRDGRADGLALGA